MEQKHNIGERRGIYERGTIPQITAIFDFFFFLPLRGISIISMLLFRALARLFLTVSLLIKSYCSQNLNKPLNFRWKWTVAPSEPIWTVGNSLNLWKLPDHQTIRLFYIIIMKINVLCKTVENAFSVVSVARMWEKSAGPSWPFVCFVFFELFG